ncbi:MAG TPA: hypothetical protein PLB05_07430 [Candidatus Omnitrophota bacterium]|nr:hypothetical protein [Candidatus Omnitrophota bacterium]HPN55629.1 hypothetical protein [Candidatus Omnitrophota bacterium]
MTERIQELLDKIKNEGIEVAEAKARDIEARAQTRAGDIVARAQEEAARIVSGAKTESQKTKDVVEVALKQASRDMLLRLRKEITKTLEGIVLKDLRESLSPEVMVSLIQKIAAAYFNNAQAGDIQVALSGEDLKKLENGFLAKLKGALKQPLVLRSADNIRAGFTISFDQGKSCFDFTDESLAEFLGQYLNEHVTKILKESLKA